MRVGLIDSPLKSLKQPPFRSCFGTSGRSNRVAPPSSLAAGRCRCHQPRCGPLLVGDHASGVVGFLDFGHRGAGMSDPSPARDFAHLSHRCYNPRVVACLYCVGAGVRTKDKSAQEDAFGSCRTVEAVVLGSTQQVGGWASRRAMRIALTPSTCRNRKSNQRMFDTVRPRL